MPVALGTILLSDPFLKDPNFNRTAVIMCSSNTTGAVGFVLNKPLDFTVADLVPDLPFCSFPLYDGGPVNKEGLYFLHTRNDVIDGGTFIHHNLYWGGNFETLKVLLQQQLLAPTDIQFFVGYSGWDDDQLIAEIEEKSWIVTQANEMPLLEMPNKNIWETLLQQLGGEYALMPLYPTDPQLN
jgi:putative transcriptional regulator